MRTNQKLGGLYLVVSSILPNDKLVLATSEALEGGVDLLQFIPGQETPETTALATRLATLAKKNSKPFLVNGDLKIAKAIEADGIHFDTYEKAPSEVRRMLGKEQIIGYTVNNDAERVLWADQAGADYVSFCSVFSPCTVTQCPIVSLETIRVMKSKTSLTMFAAGGISLENAHVVLEAGVDGIAVTSALLKTKDPRQTAAAFKEIIRSYRATLS